MSTPAGNGDEDAAGILLRIEAPLAWITLNRPARLNAFAGTMRDDLHAALLRAGDDPDVRVVVVTGAGRAFCAGADLDAMEAMLAGGEERAFTGLVEAGVRVVQAIRSLPRLVIAALNGVAAGAGASLAVACDLRIASADARIGFTFNRIGLHPDWGATYHLPRLIGAGHAAELIYSGRMVPAAEAHGLGLVDQVVPAAAFTSEIADRAARLAAAPPIALRLAKSSLARTWDSDLATMLDVESAAQLECFRSADVKEGVRAFRAKRPPLFQGS